MRHHTQGSAVANVPTGGVAVPDDVIAERLAEHWRDAQGALSAATERALRADSALFSAWCAERETSALPASSETVAAFVDDQAQTKKPASIRRYVSSISHMHKAAGLPNPCEGSKVKFALKRIGKVLRVEQKQAEGMVRRLVDRMLHACGKDTIGLRDRALIAVAYDTLARVSEIVELRVEDIHVTAEGDGTIKVRRSKTDQLGEGSVRYLAPDTVQIVREWLAAAAITEGRLFRSVPKGGRIGGPLPIRNISHIYKRVAMAAELPLDTIERLSGHSTRVGAAQDMAASDRIDMLAIMQAGDWTDSRMPGRYTRRQNARRSGAARLAEIQNRVR